MHEDIGRSLSTDYFLIGNGILLDFHVVRHMADVEAIHTHEGTETIQTLIVGKDITGVGAFA
jgi:glutaryl-CoA dehydrogenase